MTIPELKRLTNRLYKLTKILKYIRMLRIVKRFIHLEDHPHCVFDWYSAPVATHHTYPEIKAWFRELGFSIFSSEETQKKAIFNNKWLRPHSSVSARGIKNGLKTH